MFGIIQRCTIKNEFSNTSDKFFWSVIKWRKLSRLNILRYRCFEKKRLSNQIKSISFLYTIFFSIKIFSKWQNLICHSFSILQNFLRLWKITIVDKLLLYIDTYINSTSIFSFFSNFIAIRLKKKQLLRQKF